MNSPLRAGVPPVVTNEAQLKWALVTARQRAQAARERIRHLYRTTNDDEDGNGLLDDSQSEYSERKHWIEEHGYHHECCSQNDDHDNNNERFHHRMRMNGGLYYGRRFDVTKRANDSSLFFPSSSLCRGGIGGLERDALAMDDDLGRVERFQMAFAAAVAAIERNNHVQHQYPPCYPPSRFDSTSTAASPRSRSTSHHVETSRELLRVEGEDCSLLSPNAAVTPKAGHSNNNNSLLVWTPQLREQVTFAAKSVLKPQPEQTIDYNDSVEDNNEVNSFVRQFERFMLQTDDSFTSHEESCLDGAPPSQDWNNSSFASPIVTKDDETTTSWVALYDGMSTIAPQDEEEEEETVEFGQQLQNLSKRMHVHTETDIESSIPGLLISFESSPLSKKTLLVRTCPTTPKQPQQHELSSDRSDTILSQPSSPRRFINYTIGSVGCGLSVVRGAHVPPLSNHYYHCSVHWERQMML